MKSVLLFIAFPWIVSYQSIFVHRNKDKRIITGLYPESDMFARVIAFTSLAIQISILAYIL